MNSSELNIEWVKCIHGVEKRGVCKDCEHEREKFKSLMVQKTTNPLAPRRIPIIKGCNNTDGCFCTGACKEVIGYRDPLFPGERA